MGNTISKAKIVFEKLDTGFRVVSNKWSVSIRKSGRTVCKIPFSGSNEIGAFDRKSAENLACSFINGLELVAMEKFHPRAVKLLRKRKAFVVVAEDEVYFPAVYAMIREDEISKERWTMDDQWEYEQTLAKRLARKEGE